MTMHGQGRSISEAPLGTQFVITDIVTDDILKYELTEDGYVLIDRFINFTKKWTSALKGGSGSEMNDTSIGLVEDE